MERADELLYAEIAEHRRHPDLAERDDILSMLLTARFEDGSAMEDRELRDQLMTLLLAGHETTATGLAWAFDLLLHHPEALERLEAELDGEEREYLDAVVEESLRVRPGGPVHRPRCCRRTPSSAVTRCPPGRRSSSASTSPTRGPTSIPIRTRSAPSGCSRDGAPETYSWIPFGGGTRRCIGAAFAQMEMRIAIETILRSVELRAASPELEKPVRRNVTLSPANGTRVIATAR